VNEKLDTMIYEVIFQLKNKLITSFLGSNYKKPVMGTKGIGGKGISICFPINKSQAELSILSSRKMKFYKESGWKELLSTYYKYHPKGTYLNKEEYKIAQKLLPETKKPGKQEERLIFRPVAKKEVLKVKQEKRPEAVSAPNEISL
jgi:hypothetical protein